jgi:outer membrane receptor protein involved in Fe transport
MRYRVGGRATLQALCAAIMLIGTAAPTLAQGEAVIRGQVLAAADGSALAGATVVLRPVGGGQPTEMVSDQSGHFAFPLVRPGEYVIAGSRDGFAPAEERVILEPREVRVVSLALGLRPVEIETEVVAAAAAIPGVHSPSSTLLSEARLESLPLAQRANLPDAIVTAAPGMIRGHDDFVHIRGHEVALNPFINGVQFWENPHVVFSPGLGVDYIESINVMTGGFSAEYGNRFGGVLDVVTKSGFTIENNGSVTAGFGEERRHNLGVEFGGSSGRTAYYLNATGYMSDRFLSPPSPVSIHNTGRAARGFAQIDFRANTDNFVKLVLMGDGANFELPKEVRDELLRPNFNNFERTRSQGLILSWDHVHSSHTMLQSALYQKWSRVRMLPNPDEFGAKMDADRTLGTLGLKGDLTRFAGRHTVKAGMDFVLLRPQEDFTFLSQPWITFTHLPNVNESHVHFRGPNLGAGIPRPVVFSGDETGGQVSVFAQDKMQLTDALTVDLGVRFDRYDLVISESHVSPRVNVAYRLPAGTVLFGSYNHFFVPPPVENLLASSAGLSLFVSEVGIPLPPLRAIKENQFEIGVTQPVAGVMNVGVTTYYRLSDEPPHTTLFPDTRFYAYANFDKGKAYGMEIKADVPRIANLGLSGYLNYALGRVWFYNPITAGFTTEAAHLTETSKFLAPMDQTHTLTSGLTYRNDQTRLWGATAFEYGSGTPGGHGSGDHEHEGGEAHEHATGPGMCPERCPSHFTQNISVGWNAMRNGQLPRLSFQFNIENVWDNVYLLSKESSMVQGQYSIPRLISGSVRVHF